MAHAAGAFSYRRASMDRDDDFEDDDIDDDWEAPEPDDDELELLPCPACGKLIYEEADACPYCGEYVTHSTSAFAGKPIWYVALAIIGVVAVIAMILH